jgi:hypothetical protein
MQHKRWGTKIIFKSSKLVVVLQYFPLILHVHGVGGREGLAKI